MQRRFPTRETYPRRKVFDSGFAGPDTINRRRLVDINFVFSPDLLPPLMQKEKNMTEASHRFSNVQAARIALRELYPLLLEREQYLLSGRVR